MGEKVYLCVNRANVAADQFDQEVVIVNFLTGRYFSLTGSGTYIWSLLHTPVKLETIIANVSEKFDRPAQSIVGEIGNFVTRLVDEHLITASPSAEPVGELTQLATQSTSSQTTPSYTPPKIEGFEDLQELIVLDPIHDVDPEVGWPVQQRMIKRD